ncbi:metallo-dependent phosphatase [Caulobacter phage DCM]|uniref:Metallo-dependent phosphatase n=1 Tax=Caulobacter phage DCM TaxID=3020391 RepID=A0AAE9WX83_9CAUD|nr:metallo-dependent phosphatase [Caulobacter phage DCM]WCD56107.1 metallo-dependent phosphatase [Caulobacter phage BL199]
MTKLQDINISVDDIKTALEENGGSIAKAAKDLRVTPNRLRTLIDRLDPEDLSQKLNLAREVRRARNFQTENNKLRQDNRALVDALGTRDGFFDALTKLADTLNQRPPVEFNITPGQGKPMTVEILLSDLQIGKLGPGYNTPVARKRLFEFGRAIQFQIDQKVRAGYRIERVVLAIIGDIIESDEKHKNSARACDSGTAEQMWNATEGIFEFVIEPLARLAIPMDVIGVTGNHDWNEHGINMFQPGKQQLSYPLYKTLELVTKRAGYDWVQFDIPEGSYTLAEIYGQKVLYEHGVGVSVSESAMKAHKIKRAEQEKTHIHYFRMGDKHTVTSFNSGQYIVNGAFFGATKGGIEYSGIAGFDSVAGQVMCFHVPRADNRLTVYDMFTIQLEHVAG